VRLGGRRDLFLAVLFNALQVCAHAGNVKEFKSTGKMPP